MEINSVIANSAITIETTTANLAIVAGNLKIIAETETATRNLMITEIQTKSLEIPFPTVASSCLTV